MGGIGTYAAHPFKPGRVLRFTLAVPARGLTVTVGAIAVYSRAAGAYRGVISFVTGWKFVPLSPDAHATIQAIVAEP